MRRSSPCVEMPGFFRISKGEFAKFVLVHAVGFFVITLHSLVLVTYGPGEFPIIKIYIR